MASIWKKGRKQANNFKFVEILNDMGPIPSGIYKLSEKTKDGFTCSFRGLVFGVIMGGENLYRITNIVEKSKITTKNDFLERYWDRYYSKKNQYFSNPISKDEALTFCSLDPSLEYAPKNELLN